MTDVLRNTLRFQDPRTSKLLNAHTNSLFGRHRGHVLYGMQLTPTGLNTVQIGAGAIYTPLGTHFYWDVFSSPSAASLDLSAALNLASTPSSSRPAVVGVFAQVSMADASKPFALESISQMGAQTIQFKARAVSISRAQGQPTINLLPLDPVELKTAQPTTGGGHFAHTWDDSDFGSTAVNPPAGYATDTGSVQNNEVLLGYVVIGSPEATSGGTSTPPTTYAVGSPGSYTWAPGIAYVPLVNPHEAVADMLGIDPLMGRVADRVFTGRAAGGATDRAFRQAAEADRIGDSSSGLNDAGFAAVSPKFGTTAPTTSAASPWVATWSTYRWPSFLRDGDSFLFALRRMDYVLRLWMNRTGDQALVKATQDTHVDSDGVAGARSYQSTLAQLLRHFDGTTVANTVSTKNQNSMGWFTAGSAAASSATADGHVIVDGVVTHDPTTANSADSHFSAIQGLDAAIFHLLRDIVGLGVTNRAFPTKAQLRDNGSVLPAGLRTHFADGPVTADNQSTNTTLDGNGRGATTGSAGKPYLNAESLYDALALLTHRTMQSSSENWLVDGNFGLLGASGYSSIWVTTGLTSSGKASIGSLGAYRQTFTGAGSIHQDVDISSVHGYAQARSLISFAGDVFGTGVTAKISFLDGSNNVLGTAETAVPVSTTLNRFSVSAYPTSDNTRKVRFTLTAAGGMSVSSLWAGGGVPAGPALTAKLYEHLSRDGGTASAMRGPLHLAPTNPLTAAVAPRTDQALTTAGASPSADYNAGGVRITNGAAGVNPTDFVVLGQLPDAIEFETISPAASSVYVTLEGPTTPGNGSTYASLGHTLPTARAWYLVEFLIIGGGGGGGNSPSGGGSAGGGGATVMGTVWVRGGTLLNLYAGAGGQDNDNGGGSNGADSQLTFTHYFLVSAGPTINGVPAEFTAQGGRGGIAGNGAPGAAGGIASVNFPSGVEPIQYFSVPTAFTPAAGANYGALAYSPTCPKLRLLDGSYGGGESGNGGTAAGRGAHGGAGVYSGTAGDGADYGAGGGGTGVGAAVAGNGARGLVQLRYLA